MVYAQFTKSNTIDMPADLPWHLRNMRPDGVDLNLLGLGGAYRGEGIRIAIYDDGSKVSHASLSTAFAEDFSGSDAGTGRHSTAVAGIVAADGRAGAVGIAPAVQASLVQVIGTSMSAIDAAMNRQEQFDVVNHSWGWTRDMYVDRKDALFRSFFEGIEDAAQDGRGGLGTVMVAAAGNDGARGGDANMSHFPSDRQVIAVAAVNDEGHVSSFSNGGASLLVSGLSGGGSRGITTTDLRGERGYAAGDVTQGFSGTSAAAPTVTGVIALMLEANPLLGWRDVQEILAVTARSVKGTGFVENGGTTWNGGGLAFSEEAGFGLVDARAAVRLAETWQAQSTSANEAIATVATNAVGRLVHGATVAIDLVLGGAEIVAETVELTLEGIHPRIGDLLIELVSPSGTVATLLDSPRFTAAFDGWTFGANAFRGETVAGTWTVKVTDQRAGGDGSLTGARLEAFGRTVSTDDLYVYTDRFSELGASAERSVLRDRGGQDTVNAAAVDGHTAIDLNPGAVSVIAGREVRIAEDTWIENAVAGDGDDVLIGNAAANRLEGGRGEDRLLGLAGDDILCPGPGGGYVDGGDGFDTVRLEGSREDWIVTHENDVCRIVHARDATMLEIVGVEHVSFADAEFVMPSTPDQLRIAALYEGILGRAADAAGLAAWSGLVEARVLGLVDVAEALLASGEFIERSAAIDEGAFLTQIYRGVLGRDPGAEEARSWLEAMRADDLSFSEVAAHVASAPEAATVAFPSEFWV